MWLGECSRLPGIKCFPSLILAGEAELRRGSFPVARRQVRFAHPPHEKASNLKEDAVWSEAVTIRGEVPGRSPDKPPSPSPPSPPRLALAHHHQEETPTLSDGIPDGITPTRQVQRSAGGAFAAEGLTTAEDNVTVLPVEGDAPLHDDLLAKQDSWTEYSRQQSDVYHALQSQGSLVCNGDSEVTPLQSEFSQAALLEERKTPHHRIAQLKGPVADRQSVELASGRDYVHQGSTDSTSSSVSSASSVSYSWSLADHPLSRMGESGPLFVPTTPPPPPPPPPPASPPTHPSSLSSPPLHPPPTLEAPVQAAGRGSDEEGRRSRGLSQPSASYSSSSVLPSVLDQHATSFTPPELVGGSSLKHQNETAGSSKPNIRAANAPTRMHARSSRPRYVCRV